MSIYGRPAPIRLMALWIGLCALYISTLASSAIASSQTDEYYRLTESLQRAYFLLDADAMNATMAAQAHKFVPSPETEKAKIDAANHMLAGIRYYRLYGALSEVDSAFATAKHLAGTIADPEIAAIIHAHAAVEMAEAAILFGVPISASRLLDTLNGSAVISAPRISARIASARAATALLELKPGEAYAQSKRSLKAFDQSGETGADYLIARIRFIAASDRLGLTQTLRQVEQLHGEFGRADMLQIEILHTVGTHINGEDQAAQTANAFLQMTIASQLPPTHPLGLSAQFAVANSDVFVGNHRESARKLQAIYNLFEGPPKPSVFFADMIMQMAQLALILGDQESATQLAVSSLQVAQGVAPRDGPYVQTKRLDAASILSQLGETEAALSLLDEVNTETLGETAGFGNALLLASIAKIYDSLGEKSKAETAVSSAFDQVPPGAPVNLLNFRVVETHSEVMYRYGKRVQSLESTRRAIAMLQDMVARETGSFTELQFDPTQSRRLRNLRGSSISVVNRLLHLLADLPASQQSAAIRSEAFIAAQFANGSKVEDALSKVAARASVKSPELAALMKHKQDLSSQISQISQQLSLLRAGLDPEPGGPQTIDESQVIYDRLRREQSTVQEQFQARFPKVDAAVSLPLLSVRDVQAQLAKDDAVLFYHHTADRVMLWTVTRDQERFTALNIQPDRLTKMINTLRVSLDGLATTRGGQAITRGADRMDDLEGPTVAAFDRTTVHKLYEVLLQPVWSLIAGKPVLYISSNGPLTSLPFSLLITKPPEGSDTSPSDLRATSWLIRSHATVTLPSLRYLNSFGNSSPDRASGSIQFSGFGNPKFSTEPAEGSGNTRTVLSQKLNSLAPLPNTKRELSAMADILQAKHDQVFLGKDATETNVKQADLSQSKVIAFATHALLSTDIPGVTEPSIVMTPPDGGSDLDDGVLTASELSLLQIGADWLIFSACNTAGSDGSPRGEGLSGLASAGLYAGAKSLLVSHWPVFDDATAELTTQTLGRYYGDPSITQAEALRGAMLGLIDDDSNHAFAHPAAWAPFVLVAGIQR